MGDALNPRSAEKVKNPPRSLEDLTPLRFGADRFHALRRLGHNISDTSVSAGRLITNEMKQMAAAEESGTARSANTASRALGDAVATMDILARGSGKKDAALVWSQYVAGERGEKTRSIDKQAVKDFGKINVKNLEKKITERLTENDMKVMRKKFGKEAAELSVEKAVGTIKNKIGDNSVFVDGKVNVRIVEGRIGAMRNRATNLKQEIRVLKDKAARGTLTKAEADLLGDLTKKKKQLDQELRKTVGAINMRREKEVLYRQINGMSLKKLEKELKALEEKIKGGFQLNRIQKMQYVALKERRALLTMSTKLRGLRGRLMTIGGISGRQLSKMLRQSGDESLLAMAGVGNNIVVASRFATNRYVRTIFKWQKKIALYPVKLAWKGIKLANRKLGVSKAAQQQVDKAVNTVTSRVRHASPEKKIRSQQPKKDSLHKRIQDNGGLKNAVKTGVKTGFKKAAQKVAPTTSAKVAKAFKRFNNNKFVKGAKKGAKFVLKAPGAVFKAVNTAVQAVKKVLLKYIMVPAALALLCVCLISALCTAIASVPFSLFMGGDADGRIDLTPYINVLNTEQAKINETISSHQSNTESNGGEYRRVYVNYLGGANSNNYKEILSMAAVYFDQDFEDNTAVNSYLKDLFNASNYLTTEKSDIYFCSGCEERQYHCYDVLDKYSTDARKKLFAASDHSGEALVGESAAAKKGCVKSALYSCKERGHGTYNIIGCKIHNKGAITSEPCSCSDYRTIVSTQAEYLYYCQGFFFHDTGGVGVDYHNGGKAMTSPCSCLNCKKVENSHNFKEYQCRGYCDGKHYDYSCPGHTEKICKGHYDLYVNVVCLGFDKIFGADPGTTSAGDDFNDGDYVRGELIDTFDITYYCSCKICCGKSDGVTAAGTKLTPGRTIAVDPDVIPLGTPVIINGHLYVAEDVGGAVNGKHIDIAAGSHQEALSLGRDVFQVYWAEESEGEEVTDNARDVLPYLDKAQELVDAISSGSGEAKSEAKRS